MNQLDNSVNSVAYRMAIRHYFLQLKRSWRLSLPALVLPGIGSTFVFFLPTLVLAKLLGHFSGRSNLSFTDFIPYLLLIGGFWMFGELLWRLAIFFLNRADSEGIRQLYVQGMDELLKKDQAFFNDNFAGSLTKRITGYARKYEDFVDTLSFNVVSNLIPTLFASVILWHYSPWLVVVLLGMLGLTIMVILPFIKRRQRLVTLREDSHATLTGYVADVIANAAAVRSFAKESSEQVQHISNVDDFTIKARHSWDYHNQVISLMTSPLYVLTNMLGLTVALLVNNNPLSIEAVIVTFSYFGTISRTVWEFNQTYRNIEASLSEAAQFTALLLEEPKIKDSPDATQLQITDGGVNFEHVSFHYPDDNKTLFEDFSLLVKPGEKVGLVGMSGGGKTTITKLLLRFMDIDKGAIYIDGQDITTVTQASLRHAMSYVPQEPLLFHRSLTDNIRYGKPEATEKEVLHATKLARAHEFIAKLPHGYDTLVGERGVKLSGGQRQRVAIARAILKDAPILVLDEATSSLDSESELLIQDALWKLMEGRTAIVIAHRLSTIQKMDRIIVLDNGKIVEQGNHKQLLKQNGTYAKLWTHQSGGFLDE